MKRMKKWLSAILCMALILPAVGQLPDVRAEELTDGFKMYEISEYREEADKNEDGTYKDYPTIDGYVFAGWYHNDKVTPVASTVTSGQYYAKFVDKNVLSVKFQLTAGTTATSEKTNIRLVTTVDTRTYKSVGFEITGKNNKTITQMTTGVWESLSGYVNEKERVYRPSEFSKDSHFFMSLTLPNVSKNSFDLKFTVTPQWTTVDGTTVKGITRSMSVNSQVAAGVILSGDSMGNIENYAKCQQTTAEGEYKVGTGAFKSAGAGSDTVRYIFRLKNTIDISMYQGGALQFWVYIGAKSNFASTSMNIEITSSEGPDNCELQWNYLFSNLQENSWNLVKLDFADATDHATGDFNYSAVKYMRVHFNAQETNESMVMIIDDVRAVAGNGQGVLLNCDSINQLSSGTSSITQVTLEEDNGYQMEPTGAYKSVGARQIRYAPVLKRAVDICAYADGALQFWLYVGDVTDDAGNKVFGCDTYNVELSSSGDSEQDRIRWTNESLTALKENAWNLVTLDFADIDTTKTKGTIDFSKVNFFRLFVNASDTDVNSNSLMIVDDIRAVEMVSETAVNETAGVIWTCDTLEGLTEQVGNDLAVVENCKVGTGAISSNGTGIQRFRLAWSNTPVDVSAYDAIQFWLYIDEIPDTIATKNITVEINSHGAGADYQELSWTYPISKLNAKSWNLVKLDFVKATRNDGNKNVSADSTKEIDLKNIKFFRLYGVDGIELNMVLDDLRAVEVNEYGEILTCNSMLNMKLGGNTTEIVREDLKEGLGAFKSTGGKNVLWKVAMNQTSDISKFADGGVHAWLRVEDVDKLNGDIHLELSSDGANTGYANTHEYEWTISKEKFSNATWTEVYLPFSDAVTRNGGADLTAVNWLRVYVPSGVNGQVTAMLDDVRAAVPTMLDVLDCDTLEGVTLQYAALTNDADECQGNVGGAFKTTTASQIRVQATLDNRVDISNFKNDKLHLQLYIDDVTKWNGLVGIEISSNGHPDKNALEWRMEPTDLKNGWNEIYLDMTSGEARNSGEIDYELINLIRVYQTSKDNLQEFTTILDDVYMVRSTQILACDEASEVQKSVTVKDASVEADRQYVREGEGAFYAEGNGQVRWDTKLTTPVDISDCKDGKLHFWFYVSDVSVWNGELRVELSSSGSYDKQEIQWNVAKSNLKNGWNEMSLSFANPSSITNVKPDYSALNYIRIYQGTAASSSSIITCIDDVAIVGYE